MLLKSIPLPRQRNIATISKHVFLFLTLYSILIYLVSKSTSLNPASIFFDPLQAHEQDYNIVRTKQAEAFIKSAWLHSKLASNPLSPPVLCIGIPSTTHERAHHLRAAIGSLLQGLSPEERNRIHLKVLIAHLDPLVHPAVHEPWLGHVADEILLYNETLSPDDLVRVVEWEESAEFRSGAAEEEKEKFDYFHLLRKCHESGAVYIAMLGDEMLAMDGWLHRSLAALEEVGENVSLNDKERDDFFSVALFHPSTSLSNYNTTFQVLTSLFLVALLGALLSLVRKLGPASLMGRNITLYSTFWICGIIIPLLLLLYFISGGERLAVFTLSRGRVVEEHDLSSQSSSCSRGLVFPSQQAKEFLSFSEAENRRGSIEEVMSRYAESKELGRWGIVPSVLQYMGKTREGAAEEEKDGEIDEDSYDAEKVWDVGFERFDVEVLKKEHQEVVEAEKGGDSYV